MPEQEAAAPRFRYPEMAAFDRWFEGWYPNHHKDDTEALAESVWEAAIRWAHHRFDLRHCKCGVYAYVHTEGRGCEKGFRKASSLRVWLHHHYVPHHIEGWLWLHLTTERMRWRIMQAWYRRRPDLCWCQMVDVILLQGRGLDYGKRGGDYCDMPVPSSVKPYRPGYCYCDPGGPDA